MKHDHLQIQTLSHKSQPGGNHNNNNSSPARVWSGSIMISSSLLSGLAIVSWYSLGPSMMVANKYTACVWFAGPGRQPWMRAPRKHAIKHGEIWRQVGGNFCWRKAKGDVALETTFYCVNGKLSLRAIQRHLNDKNWTVGYCMRKILRFSYFYRDSPRKILKSGLDGRVRWR